MKTTALRVVFAFLFLYSNCAFAQGLYQLPFERKVDKSSLIIEGKVIDQHCFWNDAHTMIYTSSTIEVYKVFKGAEHNHSIEIVTVGGSLEGTTIQATELLTLSIGQIGTFFLFPNEMSLRPLKKGKILYDVYGSQQGFLLYDIPTQKANAPFVSYSGIETKLYKDLTSKVGRAFEVRNKTFRLSNLTPTTPRTLSHTISFFTPTTVTAGAILDPSKNVLTINGNGFGVGAGSAAVVFDDANDGSGGASYIIAYNDPHILLWSDTQIQVRVPSRAGTGNLSVRDAGGVLETFATPLTVHYSVLNSIFDFSGTFYVKEQNLMNTNGAGGYTIFYSTNTAGSGINVDVSPAKVTFQRALNTWKEIAGLNVMEGGTTTIQNIANDNINTVMYDNTNSGVPRLSDGVLGVCYSYASMCGNTSLQAQRTGFDIIIRNNGVSSGSGTFTFGPCSPLASNVGEVDLESVLLHEIGHAIGLGHINDGLQGSFLPNINPGKLMNYAISNGVKRATPDYSALDGANYLITPQGNTYGSCGLFASEMTPISNTLEAKDDCPITFPATAITTGTSVNFDLAHATSNKYIDPAYNQVKCDASGIPITNNAYYAFRTNGSGYLSLMVTGYTTNPSSLSSCSTPYGYPTTGILLSLYQVNSCPTGQAFPNPVICRTFSGNGTLSDITGLAANTNYLLYVEGIENTKASFNLTFNGPITLPLQLTAFTGTAFTQYNNLKWTAEEIVNVDRMVLQRSTNGSNFIDLASFKNVDSIKNGFFHDYNFEIGNNFYRLVIVNKDASKEYSSVLNIKREDADRFTVYPNPAKESINIRLKSTSLKGYSIRLYNSVGQVILTKQVNKSSSSLQIPIAHLPNGLYQVLLFEGEEKIGAYQLSIDK